MLKNSPWPRSLLLTALILAGRPSPAMGDHSGHVSFVREVAPILVANCEACHGPKEAESNYRLDSFERLMTPGDFGSPPVTPGDLEASEFHRLITAEDAEERMPNNGDRLDERQVGIVSTWIAQGARFDGQDAAAPIRGQIPRDIGHPAAPETYAAAVPITSLAFTPSGDRLVSGGYHELLLWDATSGELVARIGNMPERIYGVAFSSNGAWLAVAGGSPGVAGEVRLVSRQNAAPSDAAKVLATANDVFFDVDFQPDGQQLVAAGADSTVRVFSVDSGEERLRISNHANWVLDVCCSPDGKQIASASRDKSAKVFQSDSGALIATHSDHDAVVRAVAYVPDGGTVVSGGGSRIDQWNALDGKSSGKYDGFGGDVQAIVTDGDFLFAGSADRMVRQFKIADQSVVRSLGQHSSPVLSIAWHRATRRLAAGCYDGTVTIWDPDKEAIVRQFVAAPGKATAATK